MPRLRDCDAFEQGLIDLIPALRRYALSTAGRGAADDLVQDTLLRAWEKRDLWEPGTRLQAWLFMVMRRVWLSKIRDASRRISAFPMPEGDTNLPATQPVAEAAIMLREVVAMIGDLSAPRRAAIKAVAFDGDSYDEAAVHLGIPVCTVRSRMFRSRAALRELAA